MFLILARTRKVANELCEMFRNNKIEKHYLAFVNGIPQGSGSGEININLSQIKDDKKEIICVDPNGQRAVTYYKVIKSDTKKSLVKLTPQTGRKHQIRVHMQWLGHPVIGDRKYSKCDDMHSNKKMMLHAHECVIGMKNMKKINITASLPHFMQKACNEMGIYTY